MGRQRTWAPGVGPWPCLESICSSGPSKGHCDGSTHKEEAGQRREGEKHSSDPCYRASGLCRRVADLGVIAASDLKLSLIWAGEVLLWLVLPSLAALHLLIVALLCTFTIGSSAWGFCLVLLEEGAVWDSLSGRGQDDPRQQREQSNRNIHDWGSELGPSNVCFVHAHSP